MHKYLDSKLCLASHAHPEAELPIRHGGAAAPPTAGLASVELPLSSSLPASMERGITAARAGGGVRRILCSVTGREEKAQLA